MDFLGLGEGQVPEVRARWCCFEVMERFCVEVVGDKDRGR